MRIRLLDEVMDLDGRGVMLLCMDDDAAASLRQGVRLVDARGHAHALAAVTMQDGVFMLHIPDGDASYFERLFRDVRVDATLFTLEEEEPCP